MISDTHKFLYIHIPKTAGTSIEQMMGHFNELERGVQDHRTLREIQALGVKDSFALLGNEGPVALAREIRGLLRYPNRVSSEKLQSYYKFTFVRNPWARVHSWYKNVMRDEIHRNNRGVPNDCDFSRFLTEFGWQTELRSQLAWINDRSGKVAVDFVGRFENLENDLDVVRKKLELPESALPHLIAGSKEDYREAYDDQTRQYVEKKFADEIDMFGYTFDNGVVS